MPQEQQKKFRPVEAVSDQKAILTASHKHDSLVGNNQIVVDFFSESWSHDSFSINGKVAQVVRAEVS